MNWPWKRKKEEPMQAPTITVAADRAPSEDLRRGREALRAAEHEYRRAADRRPAVDATAREAQRTISRNHLAELVRGALGSGS